MIEQDTVKLLRECDAGIKMGISSIGDVLGYVKDEKLRGDLEACRKGHEKLQEEIVCLLHEYRDEGKDPNLLAKGMSAVKANMKLTADKLTGDAPDKTVADLMTDGCNMGVKSLSRYLNQYSAADERSKDLARRLMQEEEKLTAELRQYL